MFVFVFFGDSFYIKQILMNKIVFILNLFSVVVTIFYRPSDQIEMNLTLLYQSEKNHMHQMK